MVIWFSDVFLSIIKKFSMYIRNAWYFYGVLGSIKWVLSKLYVALNRYWFLISLQTLSPGTCMVKYYSENSCAFISSFNNIICTVKYCILTNTHEMKNYTCWQAQWAGVHLFWNLLSHVFCPSRSSSFGLDVIPQGCTGFFSLLHVALTLRLCDVDVNSFNKSALWYYKQNTFYPNCFL